MRKKSHISLAGYLVREMEMDGLEKYRKSFYFGSVLPDLTFGFVMAPHEYTTSWQGVKDRIRSVVEEAYSEVCTERSLWRRIGVIVHYLADYFTFPHNTTYEGSLRDHCVYEGDMKHELRAFIQTEEAKEIFRKQQKDKKEIATLEELFSCIENAHRSYMKIAHSVADDCRWIVELCSRVLIGIVALIEKAREYASAVPYPCV